MRSMFFAFLVVLGTVAFAYAGWHLSDQLGIPNFVGSGIGCLVGVGLGFGAGGGFDLLEARYTLEERVRANEMTKESRHERIFWALIAVAVLFGVLAVSSLLNKDVDKDSKQMIVGICSPITTLIIGFVVGQRASQPRQ